MVKYKRYGKMWAQIASTVTSKNNSKNYLAVEIEQRLAMKQQ